jgi:hypothetical protein
VLGISILVFAGALAVANSSLHGGLSKYADRNKDTFVGRFYGDYGRQRFIDVHRGIITNTISNGFLMINRRDETLTIIINRRTRLPFGADFSVGDMAVVFGHRDGNVVQAFGIQEVEGD